MWADHTDLRVEIVEWTIVKHIWDKRCLRCEAEKGIFNETVSNLICLSADVICPDLVCRCKHCWDLDTIPHQHCLLELLLLEGMEKWPWSHPGKHWRKTTGMSLKYYELIEHILCMCAYQMHINSTYLLTYLICYTYLWNRCIPTIATKILTGHNAVYHW